MSATYSGPCPRCGTSAAPGSPCSCDYSPLSIVLEPALDQQVFRPHSLLSGLLGGFPAKCRLKPDPALHLRRLCHPAPGFQRILVLGALFPALPHCAGRAVNPPDTSFALILVLAALATGAERLALTVLRGDGKQQLTAHKVSFKQTGTPGCVIREGFHTPGGPSFGRGLSG